jgi:hypothetical protein
MRAQTKPKLDAIAVIPLAGMVLVRFDDDDENAAGSECEDIFHPSPARVVHPLCKL